MLDVKLDCKVRLGVVKDVYELGGFIVVVVYI